MNDNDSFKTDDATLSVTTLPDGIIYLNMSGNMNAAGMPTYRQWADEVHNKIKLAAEKDPMNVNVLVDLSSLVHYDAKSSEVIYDLLKANKPLVTRSALFGANTLVKVAIESLVTITHRTNIKTFDSKEEALVWLHGDGFNDG